MDGSRAESNFLHGISGFSGTSEAAEYCKLKQYSNGELVARESVIVVDRGDSFSVRTSQTDFNSPILKDGYTIDRQGVEYGMVRWKVGNCGSSFPGLKLTFT